MSCVQQQGPDSAASDKCLPSSPSLHARTQQRICKENAAPHMQWPVLGSVLTSAAWCLHPPSFVSLSSAPQMLCQHADTCCLAQSSWRTVTCSRPSTTLRGAPATSGTRSAPLPHCHLLYSKYLLCRPEWLSSCLLPALHAAPSHAIAVDRPANLLRVRHLPLLCSTDPAQAWMLLCAWHMSM